MNNIPRLIKMGKLKKVRNFKFNITEYCKKYNLSEERFIEALETSRISEMILSGGMPSEFIGYANPTDLTRFAVISPAYVAGHITRISFLRGDSEREIDIQFIAQSLLIKDDWEITAFHPRIIRNRETDEIKLVTFDVQFNNLTPSSLLNIALKDFAKNQ